MRDTFPEKRVDPDEKFQEVCEWAEEILVEEARDAANKLLALSRKSSKIGGRKTSTTKR